MGRLESKVDDQVLKKPVVGFVDSGIGGLSIFQTVIKKIPYIDGVYLADHERFPYGEKTKEFLEERILFLVEKLFLKHTLDLLVVACNTASAASVLPYLRKNLSIPVVGVVPGIKPSAKIAKTFGVLSTPLTAKSLYLKNLIQNFASNHKVIIHGSTDLVALAEKKMTTKQQIFIPKSCLDPFFDEPDLNFIVLACTHFPFLIDELNVLWRQHRADAVQWFEPSEAIAKQVHNLLESSFEQRQIQINQKEIGTYFFYSTNTFGRFSLSVSLEPFGMITFDSF